MPYGNLTGWLPNDAEEIFSEFLMYVAITFTDTMEFV
jgi:hypothetical protein